MLIEDLQTHRLLTESIVPASGPLESETCYACMHHQIAAEGPPYRTLFYGCDSAAVKEDFFRFEGRLAGSL